MRARALVGDEGRNFELGQLINVDIPKVDRSPVAPKNLVCCIVEITSRGFLRLATPAGVLNRCYNLGDVTRSQLPINATNLKDVLVKFRARKLPKIALRSAVRRAPEFVGHSKVSCRCKGKCMTNRCPCRASNRRCNSTCHPKNSICSNHD